MLLMHANSREDVKEANTGDIVALAGLKYTIPGHTYQMKITYCFRTYGFSRSSS